MIYILCTVVHIVCIVVHVYRLTVTYGTTVSPRHGGEGGYACDDLVIYAGEYIDRVFVHYNSWLVTALQFRTNRQTVQFNSNSDLTQVFDFPNPGGLLYF